MTETTTSTRTPPDELRTAVGALRERPADGGASDVELAERLADLLEEHARQYELPPCNDPSGVCNRCEWSPGVMDALAVARVINGTVS